MSDSVQRVRYFDGEYLRSFDLQAEQEYHRAMRYRLSEMLHLTGIVSGLFLEEDQDSVVGCELFHITPGMAVDGNGKEIMLFQPLPLTSDLITKKKGLKSGPNNVWLIYGEQAITPPSIGYAACNQQNQNTRWQETYSIDFTPSIVGTVPTHPDGAILLGLAQIDSGATGLKISSVKNLGRTYVGINAQRAIHPVFADPAIDPTALNGTDAAVNVQRLALPGSVLPDIAGVPPQAPDGWFDIQAGIFGRQDLYVTGNTVLGEDFDPGTNKPTISGTRGNVKISGDLMLRGKLFSANGIQWNSLDDLIAATVAQVVPDIQIDFKDIPPTATAPNVFQAQGSTSFTVTSKLTVAGRAIILPSITRVQFAPGTELSNWYTALGSKLDISVKATATPSAGSQNQFDVTLSWIMNPLITANATMRPVESVQLTYLLVSFKS
jgi:hypothetical protein